MGWEMGWDEMGLMPLSVKEGGGFAQGSGNHVVIPKQVRVGDSSACDRIFVLERCCACGEQINREYVGGWGEERLCMHRRWDLERRFLVGLIYGARLKKRKI
jgi:hypothetical protein